MMADNGPLGVLAGGGPPPPAEPDNDMDMEMDEGLSDEELAYGEELGFSPSQTEALIGLIEARLARGTI